MWSRLETSFAPKKVSRVIWIRSETSCVNHLSTRSFPMEQPAVHRMETPPTARAPNSWNCHKNRKQFLKCSCKIGSLSFASKHWRFFTIMMTVRSPSTSISKGTIFYEIKSRLLRTIKSVDRANNSGVLVKRGSLHQPKPCLIVRWSLPNLMYSSTSKKLSSMGERHQWTQLNLQSRSPRWHREWHSWRGISSSHHLKVSGSRFC